MAHDRRAVRRPDGSRYRSYLLRLWQETPGDADRVVLQDVVSGEWRGFSSLESLFAYLNASRAQTDGDGDGSLG
jgi:hypothetical protein